MVGSAPSLGDGQTPGLVAGLAAAGHLAPAFEVSSKQLLPPVTQTERALWSELSTSLQFFSPLYYGGATHTVPKAKHGLVSFRDMIQNLGPGKRPPPGLGQC